MLTLISRTYRRLAGAVVAVAVVTLGLYATDPRYPADSDAAIVATLPEVEVIAEPIEW